jgi:group II intron reverse transcriptase/maturase
MAKKDLQTILKEIAIKATAEKSHRFGGLYHLLNEEYLKECFKELKKTAAPGVDGVTVREYAKDLDSRIHELVERLKRKAYRAKLVRRKHIPKGPGKTRPLGIPCLEDKLLQLAVSKILGAIYEADFLGMSYAYRPGTGAQEAVRELTDELFRGNYNFLVEADIKGFFDNIDHDWMERMLEQRINDKAILRLIRKWLKAGIMEETGKRIDPETGTPQGGVISPILANIYLHFVLDLWFEKRMKKTYRGQSCLFRFADDFVAAFEYRHEAEAFEKELKGRLRKFGLETAPEKTRTMRFGRNGKGHNGRFEFLGFEFYWDLSRKGKVIVKRRTSSKKIRGSMERFTEWIRKQRHSPQKDLMKTLKRKIRGYWRLGQYYYQISRILFKWLNRRSQKRSLTWREFNRVLKRHDISQPRLKSAQARRKEAQLELKLVVLLGPHYQSAVHA